MTKAEIIVRWRGFGVQFNKRFLGRMFSVVEDEVACRFGSVQEAKTFAQMWNLDPVDLTLAVSTPEGWRELTREEISKCSVFSVQCSDKNQ